MKFKKRGSDGLRFISIRYSTCISIFLISPFYIHTFISEVFVIIIIVKDSWLYLFCYRIYYILTIQTISHGHINVKIESKKFKSKYESLMMVWYQTGIYSYPISKVQLMSLCWPFKDELLWIKRLRLESHRLSKLLISDYNYLNRIL